MKENNKQLIYQALSEIAGTFFRFGSGIGDEPYIKQYSKFVANVMGIRDRTIIDKAIAAWGRTQTKFDVAAVAFCTEQDLQTYAEMKRPFVSNRLVEKPFDYNAFLVKVEERFLADDIFAIKFKAFLYMAEDKSKDAASLYKLAAIWGDTFAIKACEYLAVGSDKIFWTELFATVKNKNKTEAANVLKVAKAMKLLKLYEYKGDTVMREAVDTILSDNELHEIDMKLKTKNFIEVADERIKIGFVVQTEKTEE